MLYSGGGIHSAQAWFLLQGERLSKASTRCWGGLDAWTDEVLFPSPLPESEPDAIERARFVSEYFGGAPRGVAESSATTPTPMPRVEIPSGPVVPQRGKKKKEGC